MPELPEVEIVVRALSRLLEDRTIKTSELLRPRLVPDSDPSSFAERLSGVRILSVDRRGKHILIGLNNSQTLITHLRMSGRFMLLPAERENPKFTHAIFHLDNETSLIFQDQRHFGMMKIVATEQLGSVPELSKLAPEPFSDEFSARYFRNVLRSSQRSLKEVLLDQTKVCGLGNIYASEAMYLARANPRLPAKAISTRKAHVLYGKILEVLRASIDQGSTLNIDPENIDRTYYGGGYESFWYVYDREGLPCAHCARPIVRLKQAGRSTYFCPKCQR